MSIIAAVAALSLYVRSVAFSSHLALFVRIAATRNAPPTFFATRAATEMTASKQPSSRRQTATPGNGQGQ
jgi:hypothetical protein